MKYLLFVLLLLPTLVFSQDEEEELKYKNNNLLHQLKARLNVLKRWV